MMKNSLFPIICIGVLLLAVIGCGERITETVNDQDMTWPLRDDMMNLAVLLADYLSYEFEGGHLSFYPSCESCDADSLPFRIIFNDTWDFANIAFFVHRDRRHALLRHYYLGWPG